MTGADAGCESNNQACCRTSLSEVYGCRLIGSLTEHYPDNKEPNCLGGSVPIATPTPEVCIPETPTPTPTPQRSILSEQRMREIVSDHALNYGPCHLMGASPERAFPWSIVTGANQGIRPVDMTCSEGRCSSGEYRRQRFLDIAWQRYSDGEKLYYMALFYKGGPNEFDEEGVSLENQERFVGWLSYRVKRDWEVYDPTNPAHKKISRSVEARWKEMEYNSEISPYIYEPWPPREQTKIVVTEMCYKVSAPEPYQATGVTDPRFSSNGRVVYTAGDTPTYFGHAKTAAQDLNEFIQRMNMLEVGLTIVRDVTPILGTSCQALDCMTKPSLLCFSELGVDVVGDSLLLLGLGVPAKLTKVHHAIRMAQYASIAPNLGLSAYHASQNNWGAALGRAVSPLVDIGVLVTSRGAIRYRSLRQQTHEAQCDNCSGGLDAASAPPRSCARPPTTGVVIDGDVLYMNGRPWPIEQALDPDGNAVDIIRFTLPNGQTEELYVKVLRDVTNSFVVADGNHRLLAAIARYRKGKMPGDYELGLLDNRTLTVKEADELYSCGRLVTLNTHVDNSGFDPVNVLNKYRNWREVQDTPVVVYKTDPESPFHASREEQSNILSDGQSYKGRWWRSGPFIDHLVKDID